MKSIKDCKFKDIDSLIESIEDRNEFFCLLNLCWGNYIPCIIFAGAGAGSPGSPIL